MHWQQHDIGLGTGVGIVTGTPTGEVVGLLAEICRVCIPWQLTNGLVFVSTGTCSHTDVVLCLSALPILTVGIFSTKFCCSSFPCEGNTRHLIVALRLDSIATKCCFVGRCSSPVVPGGSHHFAYSRWQVKVVTRVGCAHTASRCGGRLEQVPTPVLHA